MSLASTATLVAFGTGLVAAAGVHAIVLVTLTTDREWWPPGEKTWAYTLHWSLVAAFNVSALVVAALDWNRWLLPRPSSLVAGAFLSVLGAAVFVRSAGVMRSEEVRGLDGELYTEGPYAYSRNPQYVGMLVGLVGFALLVNSLLVTVLVAAHVGWVLLLPLAEEPHLRRQFGREYEAYAERVPRFVGRKTARELWATYGRGGSPS